MIHISYDAKVYLANRNLQILYYKLIVELYKLNKWIQWKKFFLELSACYEIISNMSIEASRKEFSKVIIRTIYVKFFGVRISFHYKFKQHV